MNFIKKLFTKKSEALEISNDDFWQWFLANHELFYTIVKSGKKVDGRFLDKLTPKLQEVNTSFYPLTGMYDDTTVELVITAEGDIKSFVFVEELVASAPALPGWKFTALKPALDIKDITIKMDGYWFTSKNIHFLSNEREEYPDEIDLTLMHDDFTEANKTTISNGSLIYLDNILGELKAAILIDSVKVTGMRSNGTPIPMAKLGEFLVWREKEFVEKYKDICYINTGEDSFSLFKGSDKGRPLTAVINKDLLKWDYKASHPWMLAIEIKYKGDEDGMPYEDTFNEMTVFEDELVLKLPPGDGCLYLGRQTHDGCRTIYFACKEFRHSSKTVAAYTSNYKNRLAISYNIYRDKYWMTMSSYQS